MLRTPKPLRMAHLNRALKICLGALSIFTLSGCATYQGKVAESKNLIQQRHFEEAILKLDVLAETSSKDQLLYVLDRAMALHLAGKYKESAREFLRAEELAEIKDYTSISGVLEATLGGEEGIQYKGESYERMLIPFYLGLNYIMLGDLENAMVSVRKINALVERYRVEAKKEYEQNYLAEYLSALLREEIKDYDNALITLERAYKLNPDGPYIQQDLLRLSRRAQRKDKLENYSKQFGGLKEDKSFSAKSSGELFIIFQQGWGPQKTFSPQSYRFPTLRPVRSETQRARLTINDEAKGETQVAYDLESMAIKTFNSDWGPLIARRIAADLAKQAAANAIGKDNKALGDVAYIVMSIADRADLRHWSTLPQSFQILRVPLEAGDYNLALEGLSSGGYVNTENLKLEHVKIEPGRRKFLTWRSLQ